MCIDAMSTEGRKLREARTNLWRRKKSVYAGVVKAALRKCAGKSPRKPRYRPNVRVCVKQKQAETIPSGAMAPRNTTQYLMELVYSELNVTEPAIKKENSLPPQDEHTHSYTSYTDEDTMDFQQRDFERVLFLNEL